MSNFASFSRSKKRKGHIKEPFNWLALVLFFLLLAYALSLLFPVLWALLSSFKSPVEYDFLGNKTGWPQSFTFDNYVTAYRNFYVSVYNSSTDEYTYFYMLDLFGNSLLYSVLCALAATLTPCLVAYAVARFNFKFSKVIYSIVIVTMALPIVGALPSEIQMAKSLGIFDTFIGLFIMKANFLGIYFLVFYAQFKSLPMAYSEAAKIDGASQFRVMVQVVLPLCIGTIMTVFLLNFITYWNDYQIPMVYLPSHPVAAFGMYEFQNVMTSELANTPTRLSGIFIMAAPIVVVFAILNKRLMVNLSVGGIKG